MLKIKALLPKLALLILALGYLNAFASTDACSKAVAGAPKKSSVRDEIYSVAQEMRSLQENLESTDVGDWKKQAYLKSEGVHKTLIRMQTSLSEAVNSKESPFKEKTEVKKSAAVLADFIRGLIESFQRDGIRYHWFLKISFFYSVQMDMFWSNNTGDFRQSPVVPGYFSDGFEPEFSSAESILKFLDKDRFYLDRQRGHQYIDFDLYSHFSAGDPLIFVPTFADLGFESLLWLQSRGVAVLGLTETPQNVDGVTLLPAFFFYHDFLHAKAFYFGVEISEFARQAEFLRGNAEFFDSLVRKIEASSSSKRERLIKISILFFIYHEGVVREYNSVAPNSIGRDYCRTGLIQDLAFTSQYGRFFSNFHDTRARLSNSESDLGIAFKGSPPTVDEVNPAIVSLRPIFRSLCAKKTKKAPVN